MYSIQTGRAIFLRKRDFHDYDYLLDFFCEENGRFTVLAKGAKKTTSRLSGLFQPFSLVRYEIIPSKKTSGIARLIRIDPEIKTPYNDMYSVSFFSLLSEVSLFFLKEGIEIQKVFLLWEELLLELKNTKYLSSVIAFSFLCRFFTILGYFPCFKTCGSTGKKFSSDQQVVWDILKGVFVSSATNTKGDQVKKMSFNTLKIFAFCSHHHISYGKKINLSALQKKEIWDILWWFYRHHSEFFPRSKKIVELIDNDEFKF